MQTALIVGTGLIGASIGIALRDAGTTTYLLDVDPDAADTAAALGAGEAKDPPGTVDLAVLAVPPSQVALMISKLQSRAAAHCYVDVASVKTLPDQEISAFGCDMTVVVGGHPLVASDLSGPPSACGDLFEGRAWALAPNGRTSDAALNCAFELVSVCRAIPVLIRPEEHDRAVALVSHGPHVMASLAASRLLDSDESTLRLAGQELQDATHSAAGSPALWTDILSANAGPVADVLESFASDLLTAVATLRCLAVDGPDTADAAKILSAMLQRGVDGRARIPGKYGVLPPRAL